VTSRENALLGIDVGGSEIKYALAHPSSGVLVGEPRSIATPRDFGVEEMTEAILGLASELAPNAAVGVGLPAAISQGRVLSPPTAREFGGWVGYDLAGALSKAHGAPIRVANDADVAGLAELAFGAGKSRKGVVLMLTLGTGVGSALFHDGILVPNTELGKLYLQSSDDVAEHHVASRIKTELNLSWEEWSARLSLYLEQIDRLFCPELVILGGGISREADQFLSRLSIRGEIRAAELVNNAGIVGAARLAAEARG